MITTKKYCISLEPELMAEIDVVVAQKVFGSRSLVLRKFIKEGLLVLAGKSHKDKLRTLFKEVRANELTIDEAIQKAEEWL